MLGHIAPVAPKPPDWNYLDPAWFRVKGFRV